jgi:hypothetical protein
MQMLSTVLLVVGLALTAIGAAGATMVAVDQLRRSGRKTSAASL